MIDEFALTSTTSPCSLISLYFQNVNVQLALSNLMMGLMPELQSKMLQEPGQIPGSTFVEQ